MALVMHYVDRFHEILDKNADARTTDWFLMSSPFPTLFVCLSYVYIVKVLGPKLMENRKPFQLQNVLICYNLFQVLFSTWLFYEANLCTILCAGFSNLVLSLKVLDQTIKLGIKCLMGGWWSHYSFRCQPVDYSNSPTAIRIGMSGWLNGEYSLRCQPVDYSDRPQVLRMVHACWWYYFSKFTELMDTIFFVLRKKNSHVSTLHVIHHGCMPMSVWFGVKFTPGGHSTFFGLLNTFVHIIMYSYYLLAALGPKVQPYLWWKKYLTAFQMMQFIFIMIHAFQLLFIDCNYPKAFVWWIGLHAVMFFFLFNEFYQQSYAQKKSLREAKIAAAAAANRQAASNGLTNGKVSSNGTSEIGVRRKEAADYYVKGDTIAANELSLRKPYASIE